MLRRVASLEETLRDNAIQLETAREEAERTYEQGKTEGRAIGLSEALSLEAERLSVLEGAVRGAHAALREALASLTRLAPLLAREALDILFAEPEYRASVVAKLIGFQTAKIENAAILQIEVSKEDFPDQAALQALAEDCSFESIIVKASEKLSSGGCTMALRLGQLHVGIDQQWGVLGGVLHELAQAECR
ncbi:MAG: hypothetical protein WDM89_06865 [Rhizomicrobium sp.]